MNWLRKFAKKLQDGIVNNSGKIIVTSSIFTVGVVICVLVPTIIPAIVSVTALTANTINTVLISTAITSGAAISISGVMRMRKTEGLPEEEDQA